MVDRRPCHPVIMTCTHIHTDAGDTKNDDVGLQMTSNNISFGMFYDTFDSIYEIGGGGRDNDNLKYGVGVRRSSARG